MNYLYFAEEEITGTGKAAMYPASSFIGLDPISATTTRLSFKSRNNAGAGDDDILLNHTGRHSLVAELIASVLEPSPGNRGKFIVVADQANGVYLDNGSKAGLNGDVTITTLA
tara:strand:- start:750 stop:1088 length:339 start_codon:yes stop_codon:yes gene_type:complete